MKQRYHRTVDDKTFPVVPVTIISPVTGVRVQTIFRVDTGADMTLIPMKQALKLQLDPTEKIYLADYDMRFRIHQGFFVHITIGDQVFTGIEVVASKSNAALLGLDILNQLKLTLDGPNKSLIIH